MKTRMITCLLTVVVMCLAACNQNEAVSPEKAPEKATVAQIKTPDAMQIEVDDKDPSNAPEAPAKANPSDPVARVGSSIITQRNFDATVAMMSGEIIGEIDEELREEMSELMPPEKTNLARHLSLNILLDTKILLELAMKAGFTMSDEEVRAKLQEMIAGLPQEVTFEELLKMQGMTEEDALDSLKAQYVVQPYLESFEETVTIDEAALQAHYDKLKAEGRLDSTDVALIRARPEGGPGSDAATLQKVQEARKRIVEGGESFGAVAREVSDDLDSNANGGLYPEMPKGRMGPEIDAVMESTAIGEVSEPFKTDAGWHILTVTARNAVPMDDLRPSFVEKAAMKAIEAEVAKAREEMDIEILIDLPPLSGEDTEMLQKMHRWPWSDAQEEDAEDEETGRSDME